VCRTLFGLRPNCRSRFASSPCVAAGLLARPSEGLARLLPRYAIGLFVGFTTARPGMVATRSGRARRWRADHVGRRLVLTASTTLLC